MDKVILSAIALVCARQNVALAFAQILNVALSAMEKLSNVIIVNRKTTVVIFGTVTIV
jgi:hypothetical protein